MKYRPGGRTLGGPQMGGGGNMMKQIQKMQEDMLKTQEALAAETMTITAGGGAVSIVITGQQEIKAITLKPEIVDPADVEMLQDLIVAAVNEAITASKDHAAKKMEGLTGGLNIPGL